MNQYKIDEKYTKFISYFENHTKITEVQMNRIMFC